MIILLALAGLPSCGANPPPVTPARKPDPLTLRLAPDGALLLGGEAIDRRDLAKELARLADRLRIDAKLAGEPVTPDRSLSAVMVYQADGKTPFSAVHQLALEAQSAGFRRWSFVLDSEASNSAGRRPVGLVPARVLRNGNGDLPVELRSIPIRLPADDQGNAVRIGLAEREFPDFDTLEVELASLLNEPENPFDQVILMVDPGLDFAELVHAVNLIASLSIRTIDLMLANPK
jgi:biopolymer transport protein ExbD